jgi:GNAT superfamily N-acetyltransferase
MENIKYPVTDVTSENLEKVGFFCYMSARKTDGYARKQAWVRERLAEGLRIRMVLPPEGRGFIEYLRGESAWRAVNAAGYMFVHCLWVVGKSKGMGVASQLMELCEQDARESGLRGVAMVTSEDHYMIKNDYLEKRGYHVVDDAPPAFSLMVKQFAKGPSPAFCGDWERKAAVLGSGLTVLRVDQCPYLESAVTGYRSMAEEIGVSFKDILLDSARDVRDKSPSAYGTFSLIYNGKLIGDQFLNKEALILKIAAVNQG